MISTIRQAIKESAGQGASVLYPSGHTDKLDVAVRRATLTGVNQTMGQVSLEYAEEFGCDIMEITAHSGARPSHAVWQGQLVSRSGKPGYLSLSDIGYGTGAGFMGWNCRHSWNPFFEGISEISYDENALKKLQEKNVEYKGVKYTEYEISQMQRSMERDIRATKRELAGLDEAVKEAEGATRDELRYDFAKSSIELKRQKVRLADLLSQSHSLSDSARAQVLGFGRSTAQKASHVLTNASGKPIIKVEKTRIEGPPNGITQITNKNGGIDRNYYGSDGKQTKQISNNDHGQPKLHPYGKKGEHAHDYVYDEGGNLSERPMRGLTDYEEKENSDIL